MKTMKYILLTAFLGLSACQLLGPNTLRGVSGDLQENRERWKDSGITSYQFTFQNVCFCIPATATLTVTNGVITDIKVHDNGDFGEDHEKWVLENYTFYTIEELFDQVGAAISDNAHGITAEYNADFGYPTNVYIDYHENVADEEWGFLITDFVR